MHIKQITFYNGMKIIVTNCYKVNRFLYCYYWFNNCWFPTVLDYFAILDICEYKSFKFNNRNYQRSHNTYGRAYSGGSDIFTNTENGIKLTSVSAPGGNISLTSGTVVPPVFPDINPNWFYTGFPTNVSVGALDGNLVDYIPIYFYATKNGTESFTLPKLPDRVGYLDSDNVFTETLVYNSSFKKGDLLFTLLLDKNDPACANSKINNKSYWNLLTEFSNIDPGSTATKTITITSGITKQESYSMSLSIGSKVGIEAGLEGIGKISAEISSQLSNSFNSSVSITQQITTTDTVEFKAQPRTQRIATYQFIERFTIDAADPLKEKVNSFNNATKNYVANFAKADFEAVPFDYGSRYFAKAFVLEPTN